MKKQRECDSPK